MPLLVLETKTIHFIITKIVVSSSIAAQEGAEDSAIFGVADLKKIFSEFKEPFSVVYIGITCGMSAPYIAGQVFLTLSYQPTNQPTNP